MKKFIVIVMLNLITNNSLTMNLLDNKKIADRRYIVFDKNSWHAIQRRNIYNHGISKESDEMCLPERERVGWDYLPTELQEYIITFIVNTRDLLIHINNKAYKRLSKLLREWYWLNLVNTHIRQIVSGNVVFDKEEIVKLLIGKHTLYFFRVLVNPSKKNEPIALLRFLLKNGLSISNIPYRALSIASQRQCYRYAEELINNGIYRDVKNEQLFRAIYLGEVELVSDLAQSKKKRNAFCYESGSNQLMMAAETGNVKIIQQFLPYCSAKEANKFGYTALMFAVKSKRFKAVKLLLEHGANVNKKDRDNKTPLMLAASDGSNQIVQLLLLYGADPQAKDKSGLTPLMYAALNGYVKCLALLLGKDLDINASSYRGATALMYATIGNQKEAVECLLKHGASLTVRNHKGITALMYAAYHGYIEIMNIVLNGDTVSQQDAKERTALHFAALGSCDRAIMNLLIDYGLDLNKTASKTILIYALCNKKSDPSIIQFLIDKGALVNKTDSIPGKGKSPLMYAIERGNIALIELLLKNGADVNFIDQNGYSALWYAFSFLDEEVFGLLMDHQAYLYQRNSHGKSMLTFAVESKNGEAVLFLLKFNMNPNEIDGRGKTSLDLAVEIGDAEMIQLFNRGVH